MWFDAVCYWENIIFNEIAPDFTHYQKNVFFKVNLNLFRPTASSNSIAGRCKECSFCLFVCLFLFVLFCFVLFCFASSWAIKLSWVILIRLGNYFHYFQICITTCHCQINHLHIPKKPVIFWHLLVIKLETRLIWRKENVNKAWFADDKVLLVRN